MKIILGLLLLLLVSYEHAKADIETDKDGKFTISGYLRDKSTGEELIGASIYVASLKTGTTTNVYGFYSLTLPQGKYEVMYSYMGFMDNKQNVDLSSSDVKLNLELDPDAEMIQTVEIVGERQDENIQKVEMSVAKIPMKTIKKMPALMGEVDLIKSIQLLPGVATAGEGFSGYYVRGGGVDQNLILLDEATVYNASHLGGLFSVFNSDAIKEVTLYKGGIPAEYGGRLSSLLDVRMKDGNTKQFGATGGIGVISSRLTLETPIVKDRASFIISGRRTYYDVFLAFAKDTSLQNTTVFFHDLNTKLNWRINDNNRVFLSGYLGRDVFGYDEMMSMGYGNRTLTGRWNHLFSDKLFSNFTAIYSDFDYSLGASQGIMSFVWDAKTVDKGAKADLTYYVNPRNTIKFGINGLYHIFHPGTISSDKADIKPIEIPKSTAMEYAIFLSNEQKIRARLSLQYGLRVSMFQNIGKGKVFVFDKTDPQNYVITDTLEYDKNEFFNTYAGLEPRLGIKCTLDENSSLKASYNRTFQYLQLATNSTSSTPLDVWFPCSPNIKPQKADQVAIGYFRNFMEDAFETSAEVYYKKMYNSIDYKDHASLLLNEALEGEIRVGDSYSYGLELYLKKQEGRFTGWISYTLSKTMKSIPEINNGNPYSAPYDKPHDLAIILSYELLEGLNVSGNWIYSSGRPITVPKGRYEYNGMIVPVYTERNSARMPDYHRADVSATYTFGQNKKKEEEVVPDAPKRKFESSLNLSVYNVYSRHNPFTISFKQDDVDPTLTYAESMYLFKIFPSLTYNFKF